MQRSGALKLQKDGLLFTESDVSKINSLYKAIISEHAKKLPKEIAASKNGWKSNKNLFIVGSTAITENEIKSVLQRDNPTVDSYSQKGCLEKQVWAINQLIKYPAVAFKMFTACLPPLLPLLNLPSFVEEQRVGSGKLKTTMGYIASSIWGDPIQLQLNPNSSSAGIEQILKINTDLPIFIDETSISDKIKDLVYLIANGVGRTKSNSEQGLVVAPTWSTVVLTTGEKPILPESALVGQQVRIVQLRDGVRDYLQPELVQQIDDTIKENFGHIGILFMQEVFKNKSKLKLLYNEFFSKFPKTNDITADRAKKYYAGIAVAGHLLENVFEQIDIEPCNAFDICNYYYNENVLENKFVPDYIKALRSAFSLFSANETCFDEEVNNKRLGWVRDDKEHGKCICYIPEQLKNHLNTDIAPNTYEGNTDEWKNLDILVPKLQKDNKTDKIYKLKINQISTPSGKRPVIKIPLAKFREYLGIEEDKKEPEPEQQCKKPESIPDDKIHHTVMEDNVALMMGAEGL